MSDDSVSELYRTDMGRLLRYVCENPHVAGSVLWQMESFDPEEILVELMFVAELDSFTGDHWLG